MSLIGPSIAGFQFYVQSPDVGYWAWVGSCALVATGALGRLVANSGSNRVRQAPPGPEINGT
jgi:hypothetical protein